MTPVVVEQSYAASAESVWNAITDPVQMRKWFFDSIGTFSPVVGFQTRCNVRNGDKDYLHVWKITDVVPQKRITYDWTYEGYPGYSFVRFELFPAHGETTVRLTHAGIESFPQDNPDFSRESCTRGWTFLLGSRLKEFLAALPAGTGGRS